MREPKKGEKQSKGSHGAVVPSYRLTVRKGERKQTTKHRRGCTCRLHRARGRGYNSTLKELRYFVPLPAQIICTHCLWYHVFETQCGCFSTTNKLVEDFCCRAQSIDPRENYLPQTGGHIYKIIFKDYSHLSSQVDLATF